MHHSRLPSLANAAITRRRFNTTAAAGLLLICRKSAAADFSFRQYHNQPVESPLHKRLTEMWAAVNRETGGRVQTTIVPENNHQKDGDPNPLDMLIHGELEFYTLAGNGLSSVVLPPMLRQRPMLFAIRRKRFAPSTVIWELIYAKN